jgi:hypothetical protein
MTLRTQELIICECGHKGFLLCSENDQPYSSLWEDYSLSGFDGGELTVTSYADKPKDILAHLKPICPECHQAGKVSYANRA